MPEQIEEKKDFDFVPLHDYDAKWRIGLWVGCAVVIVGTIIAVTVAINAKLNFEREQERAEQEQSRKQKQEQQRRDEQARLREQQKRRNGGDTGSRPIREDLNPPELEPLPLLPLPLPEPLDDLKPLPPLDRLAGPPKQKPHDEPVAIRSQDGSKSNPDSKEPTERGRGNKKEEPGPPREERDKNQDLPDVALVPEETSPAVKAVILDNARRLYYSKSAAARANAADVLGELGEQGKPVRRLLCRAMLDSYMERGVYPVRVAAADALKKIDPKLQYLAVQIAAERMSLKRRRLLTEFQKLEDDGEPLTPLVAALVAVDRLSLAQIVTTLSHIAKSDLWVYGKIIVPALGDSEPAVRRAALQALPRMKHRKQAVPKIIRLLHRDEVNRIAAIQALTALADESNEEAIIDAIGKYRYDPSEEVRKAVEVALNKLQNRAAAGESKEQQKPE